MFNSNRYSFMKIRNIIGSSKISSKPKSYPSWLQFWEGIFGQTLTRNEYWVCPACGKSVLGKNFDGCHVLKVDSSDQKWYILPLCDSCNHRTDEPDVDGSLLVELAVNNK